MHKEINSGTLFEWVDESLCRHVEPCICTHYLHDCDFIIASDEIKEMEI